MQPQRCRRDHRQSFAHIGQKVGDSGDIQNLIRTIPGKGFRFVGEISVSNGSRKVASPDETHELRLALSPSLVDRPAVAVLPFTNMTGDPQQEYFSDGISEDI
jgi:DNA-binding winged helix-turn-helix (wHTH) protein